MHRINMKKLQFIDIVIGGGSNTAKNL